MGTAWSGNTHRFRFRSSPRKFKFKPLDLSRHLHSILQHLPFPGPTFWFDWFPLYTLRWGREIHRFFHFIIFFIVVAAVVLELFVFIFRRLAAKFPLDFGNINPYGVLNALALLCATAVVKPRFSCKVDGLSAVVAKIIARVIAIREGNNKFTLVMN